MPVGDRRLLERTELWPQELQLCAKAAEGSMLDLRSDYSDEHDVGQGYVWDAHRQIRAQVLFQLLTGQGPVLATSVVAVRLRGARIVGRLNLGGWTLRCPLELSRCQLRHRLDLAKAEAPNISLRGSWLRGRLSARRLHVAHTLNLSGLRCDGGAVLQSARISGHLDCGGAVFTNPDGNALNADGLVVDGDLLLGSTRSTGRVRLNGARIGGQLTCTEAVFTNPDGNAALSADGLAVGDSMSLDRTQCVGEVRLLGGHISGPLSCIEAVFTSPDGNALSADRLVVDGGMFLRKARCTGVVRLLNARIGLLDGTESVFTNPDGNALHADGLVVDGGLFLRKTQCTGVVRLLSARISGQMTCAEAVFTNHDGNALHADGLAVDGDVFLRSIRSTGHARLPGARISGQLACTEAVFTNPDGNALSADRLFVGGDMLLPKAQCTGEVRLPDAHVSGQLNCAEAVFTNPDGNALDAEGLVVDGGMFLQQAQCTGEVRLLGARIGGELDCTEAVLRNPDGLAVDLERATVMQAVRMRPAVLEGGLDLAYARVGAWHDARKTWPSRIRLEGFTYDSLDAPDASIQDRLRSWLPRNGYLPQPYEQLVGVYRRAGHEDGARLVAIGKQRARRGDYARWWVRWPSQAWSALLRWTIGYGYRPTLVLIPLVALLLLGSVLFDIAHHQNPSLLQAAKPGSPEQPGFNSFRYTMDLLLPVANFKQRDSFVANGWAAWAAFGFTFAGWLLAAVVVAGLTGVFKRD